MKRQTMRFASGIFAMLALILIGPNVWGQTGDSAATEKAKQDSSNGKVDTRPYETIFLKYATQANDANELTVAVRNLLTPSVKIYLVPNQNAITIRGTSEEIARDKCRRAAKEVTQSLTVRVMCDVFGEVFTDWELG